MLVYKRYHYCLSFKMSQSLEQKMRLLQEDDTTDHESSLHTHHKGRFSLPHSGLTVILSLLLAISLAFNCLSYSHFLSSKFSAPERTSLSRYGQPTSLRHPPLLLPSCPAPPKKPPNPQPQPNSPKTLPQNCITQPLTASAPPTSPNKLPSGKPSTSAKV